MINRNVWHIIAAFNIFLFCAISISYADVVRTDLTKIELSTDKTSILPGSNFTAIIELTPDPGWHAYWENPGDAGLKLEMTWDLPEGVEIGPLQFPTPHLIPYEDIVSYGYDGKVTIIAEGKVSTNYAGSEINLSGDAFWLICSDALCVPQDAKISHRAMIGENKTDIRLEELIKITKADMPTIEQWESQFHTDGENFTLRSQIPAEYPVIESAYLFPRSEGMIENTYAQDLSFINGEIIGRFKNAYGYEDRDTFNFVLTFKTGEGEEHAIALSSSKSVEPVAPFLAPVEEMQTLPSTDIGFATALIFAFLGGMILNLMPCVFPILSLKAMSVLELSRKDPAEARMSGLAYTAGIMVSFGAVGALVSVLSLGWGFHMQIPIINFLLGLLMVAIGLNLLGVYEVGSSLMGIGQGLVQNGSSRKSSFFTGVLAVVVATPCTAPFMAGALGYAFLVGGVSGMVIFLALGFGLAFPYLLICYVPAFRNALPRPGKWMESLKNILGLPMLATALWLFWILGNQIGVNAMTLAIGASLLLGFALWGGQKKTALWKGISVLSLVGVLASGYYLSMMKNVETVIAEDDSGLKAVVFSSDGLQRMLDNDQAVFVYFTADWCVTCKLNERATLSQAEVHAAFEEKDVTVMVGDWTSQNPDITRTLQSYGRIGVPLYLYFPVGRGIKNPDILPQILTPSMVIDAL